LSADGKIVLADDLYPMTIQHTNGYFRGAELYNDSEEPCAATAIWNYAWNDAGYNLSLENSISVEEGFSVSLAQQTVVQVAFSGSSIDWARVKKLTVNVSLSFSGDSAPARVTKAMNSSTIPSDKTIRDTWEKVFDETDTSGVIEWEINGVEPTSVEIAFMFDAETCPLYTSASYFTIVCSPVHIIYNLAA
jgi:hypothetical protein